MAINPMCLEISSLSKIYESEISSETIRVFEKIDLNIAKGEFVSIVGPSGCGKTTLLRIIAGLDHASDGEIRLDGEPIVGRDKRIGLVFQEFALFPWRTTLENIEIGLEIMGVEKKKRIAEAKTFIDIFGLHGFENKYPKELSGGMKQRVAIARTLITQPEVMLMDEPFGALDSQTRNNLQNFLLRIWSKTKETIIFVTHNVDEAVYLSDKILVLSKRPASILKIHLIDSPRPRDRTSPESNAIRKKILDILSRKG